jgi:hypothetical protein
MWYGATGPQFDEGGRLNRCVLGGSQKQTVPQGIGTTAGAAHPLQKTGDRHRGVNLDYPVQVADVDPEFKDTGCHDDAIVARGKRILCLLSLFAAQRAVGHEGGHA